MVEYTPRYPIPRTTKAGNMHPIGMLSYLFVKLEMKVENRVMVKYI